MKTNRLNAAGIALGIALFSGGAAFAESATVNGQVKKVDNASSKVTIRHDAVKAGDMSDPMTMVYRVKDPVMLKVLRAGDNVTFDYDHDTSGYVITRIEKK